MTWLHDIIAWLSGALVALAAAMGLGGDAGPWRSRATSKANTSTSARRSPAGSRRWTWRAAPRSRPGRPCSSWIARASSRRRDDAAARLARRRGQARQPREGQAPLGDRIRSRRSSPRQGHARSLSETELRAAQAAGATRVESRGRGRRPAPSTSATRRGSRSSQAELETAQLGARADEIEAAEAEVRAARAQLAQAEWRLDELSQAAPQAGLVVDTLYRPGEWVAAGAPVVSLLPPQNIMVRFFVPEPRLGAIAGRRPGGGRAAMPARRASTADDQLHRAAGRSTRRR